MCNKVISHYFLPVTEINYIGYIALKGKLSDNYKKTTVTIASFYFILEGIITEKKVFFSTFVKDEILDARLKYCYITVSFTFNEIKK